MEAVCTTIRPGWDGMPVTALGELQLLALSPVTLVLFVATLICIRMRSQWGSVAVVVAWSIYVSLLTMIDPGGLMAAGRSEGCIGAPTLFIALVAAICVAMIIYTAPSEKRET